MTVDPDRPIITVTATIMDGQVVRWFVSPTAAEAMRPWLSASCHGVAIHAAYLTDIPSRWIEHATQVHRALAAKPKADASHLATHRRRGLSGPLEEVHPDLRSPMPDPDPDPDPTHGLVSMGVPPPVPFWELPVDVQAQAVVDGEVAPLDYDG